MKQNRCRKANRLENFDYSEDGDYFVTICTHNRINYFGHIINGKMVLNVIGKIAYQFFKEISIHFKQSQIIEFIVMPNHIHGIIRIMGDADYYYVSTYPSVGIADTLNDNKFSSVGIADLRSLRKNNKNDTPCLRSLQRTQMLLSKIIHQYKSSVTREINKIYPDSNFEWQHSYYDHIIRNNRDFENIRQYIKDNPENWLNDSENK
jgi:putative transposase